MSQIEKMSVYLVLNTAALLKDQRTAERNELKKIEQQYKKK